MVKKTYRIIIAGNRTFNNYALLKEQCEYLLHESMVVNNIVIVSGHAAGADTLGERFAAEHGLKCELHPADWKRYGKAAGPIRNAEMAAVSDALIAFWDGKSRGTRSMINLARDKGMTVAIVRFDKINICNNEKD